MSSRWRKSVACVCLVVVALAACLPGVATLDYAVPALPWILLPDLSAAVVRVAPSCDEQPSSLLSFVSSRAPPQALS